MQRITLEIENTADLELLLLLIHRMGISIVNPVTAAPIPPKKSREWHLQVVARGSNMSSIPDPVAWQRELRQDKPLPFRED